MSVEPRKVFQVIRYMDNISSGEDTQHVKTISAHDEEDEEDSYNHLIEEQDIISYDSESSTTSTPLMESPTIVRPAVLDLAGAGKATVSGIGHDVAQEQVQVSPRLVYVKLTDSADHVITVNRPTAEDISRMLSANHRFVTDGGGSGGGSGVVVGYDEKMAATTTTGALVNMSTGAELSGTTTTASTITTAVMPSASASANDEELTSLTWLQDKNLIQGINLTTSKSHPNGGSASSGAQTENAATATISPNCDKQKPIAALANGRESSVDNSENGLQLLLQGSGDAAKLPLVTPLVADQQNGAPGTPKAAAISELTTKILNSSSLPPSISHLSPSSKGVITRNESLGPLPQQHVHKKYRREEHVKITKQQQQQQYQQHQQQLQLTPTRSSLSPNSGLVSPYSDRSMSSRKYSEESLSYHSPSHRNGSKQAGGNKQKHPVNVPYNPFVHTTNKPPLSFSSLIFMAIENATEKALPVKEIYAWIVKHFPYFKTAPTGWKNSVRHNLSLNKCFQKVEKAPNMGKGSLWKVEQQYRQVLMQALTRSPYHQFAGTMDRTGGSLSDDNLGADTNNNNVLMCNSSPSSSSNISSTSSSLSTSPTGMDPHHNHHHHNNNQGALKTGNARPFDPVLFPYLSKSLSKLDTNNNAMYANYNLSFVDSESESTGFYDHLEGGGGGDGPNAYHHRFGNGGYSFAQYPYDGHVDNSTDNNNMDDVNAATAMLALKHGRIRNGHPVITSSPSEDHTYSAGNENADEADKVNGNVGSINGVKNVAFIYEGDDRALIAETDVELEEQRRKAEGVDALLNLAGFSSNTSQILMKRRASSDMMSLSNDSSLDCNSSAAVIFSSPSPTKRSKTRYLQSPSVGSLATAAMR